MLAQGPISLVPAGIARYTGAAAALLLTSTPSDSGSGGVALPPDKRFTDSTDMRTVNSADIYASGGGVVTVTYDGSAPTAAYGFPLPAVEQIRNIGRSALAAMQFYVPAGTTLHVRYFWGSL